MSSSTASTISPRGFAAAELAFQKLYRAYNGGIFANTFREVTENIRCEIKAQFDLPTDTDIILSPSGTDAELQALFLACCICQKPITSVIVAADETGSGVPSAAAGRHFSSSTSGGRNVVKNEPIAGLGTDVALVTVAARDERGPRCLSEIDMEVQRAVSTAVRAGRGVALHVMDYSKLGSRAPTLSCIDEVCARWGDAVQVIVDACQARVSRERMRYYLQRAYLVLITGSKFFTGPPFSGALLVSEQTRARIQPVFGVPQGLTDYTTRHDWPENWDWIRDQLADRINVGQSLRWVAALEDIRAYFAVPTLFRKLVLTEFSAAAVRTISRYPALQLLAQPQDSLANVSDEDEIASCSIFPFTVIRDGRPLSYAQTKTLYHALNQNVSDLFPKSNGQAEIASTPCHIGQPVAIGIGCGEVTGALRISADARLVSECWVRTGELAPTDRLQKKFEQIGYVFEKIRLLSPHLDRLARFAR
ncbi:MAG TPA: hypothetical protein VI358_01560 [Pseudolabrys sp.]